MIKIFLITQQAGPNAFSKESVDKYFDFTVKYDPTYILIDHHVESDITLICRHFFEKFTPYLEQNNKLCYFITTDYSTEFPSKNYIAEEHYGVLVDIIVSMEDNKNPYHCYYNSNIPIYNLENVEKIYTCYNNRADEHRYMLIDNLYKENLFDDGIITIRDPNNESVSSRYKFEYYNGTRLIDDDSDWAPNKHHYENANSIPKSYFKGLIDIVTESRYFPKEYFITEKTYKPLFTFKPFLVLGPRGYHKHLVNKLGIQLYYDWFDYSFDDEELLENRILGIVNNLKRLRQTDLHDLKLLYKKTVPILVYNKNQVINLAYNQYKILPSFMQNLINSGDKFEIKNNAGYTYTTFTKFINDIFIQGLL